jgi:hypothetical protein
MEQRQIERLMREAAHFKAGWWQDERRHWCAYCGIPMKRKSAPGGMQAPSLGTHDHVIPKAHRGGLITIPACHACNVAKGASSLPEYLESEHFKTSRKKKHRNQWPLQLLWAVAGIAALKRSVTLGSMTLGPSPSTATGPGAQIGPTADRIR